MAWVTVDDFESGSFSGDWSGNNAFVVTTRTPLEGVYGVEIDTDQTEYGPGVELVLLNTMSVDRNSAGDKTVRCLLKYTRDGAFWQDAGGSIIFLATDDNNYYRFRYTLEKNSTDNFLYLEKIVGGVITVLASYTFSDSGSTQIQSVEIKAETNLITVNTYTDTSFSVSTGVTLTSSDVTYTSGYIGIGGRLQASENQGIMEYLKLDLLEVWENAAPPEEISKVKIAGLFSSKPVMVKIGGTFVEKTMKVKVSGVFQ